MDPNAQFEVRNSQLWPADRFAEESVICLEFVNTVSWRGRPEPDENLSSPAMWLKWMHGNHLLPEEALAELDRRATMWGFEAESAFRRAIEFRESLYRMLVDATEGRSSTEKTGLDDILDRALERLDLAESQGAYAWRFEALPVDWETPLYPIALSAAQLLTSEWLGKLRTCGREECKWLFLDLTKNHSRKWCDMATCGNVMKARRSYARKKSGATARPVRSA